MSDPARSRSASRPLLAHRFAARGNALAPEIAGFEDRSVSAPARTVAGGPTEGYVRSQIARPEDGASIARDKTIEGGLRAENRARNRILSRASRPARPSARGARRNPPIYRAQEGGTKFSGSQGVENNRFGEIIAPDEVNGLQRRIARGMGQSLSTRAVYSAERPTHSATPAGSTRAKID